MTALPLHGTLTLKWGTLKGWNCAGNRKMKELLEEYMQLGNCISAIAQNDSDRQQEIILELIDVCDDPRGIYLSWDAKYVSKDEAKSYIRNYGR